MQVIKSKIDLENAIIENNMVLLYFSSRGCGVCTAVKPKIEVLLKKYPNIKAFEIQSDESLEVSAGYSIFTAPSIILFIDGKEVIRELRFISILELDRKISRYYSLYY